MAEALFQTLEDQIDRLLFDTRFVTHVCRKTGAGVTQARIGGNTNPSTMLVPLAGFARPRVAVVVAGGYAAALYNKYVSGGVTYWNFASNAPVGTAFTYYVFDAITQIPGPSGMFQLYAENPGGAASTLIFDSGYWAMKGIGLLGPGGSARTMTGRSLAVGCGSFLARRSYQSAVCMDGGQAHPLDDGPCSNVRVQVDGKLYGARITGGGETISLASISFDDVSAGAGNKAAYEAFMAAGNGYDVTGQIMIVDVTGIPLNTTFF